MAAYLRSLDHPIGGGDGIVLALGVVARTLVGGLDAADGQTGRQGQDRTSGFEPRGEGRFQE